MFFNVLGFGGNNFMIKDIVHLSQ